MVELIVTHPRGPDLRGGLRSPYRGDLKPCFQLVGMAVLHSRCHFGPHVPPLAGFCWKRENGRVGGGRLNG